MTLLDPISTPLSAPTDFDPTTARAAVNARLSTLVPSSCRPSLAARHALLAPGKRLRAILTMAAAHDCGGASLDALDAACAIEMIHTASLIFDDLPAMDNADLRRGMPTAHVAYGVDVAILGGIGLLNAAFATIAHAAPLTDAARTDLVKCLAKAVGWSGLVQGQAMDLGTTVGSLSDVDAIHFGKTGVLFVAAAEAGGIIAGAPGAALTQLAIYGRALGSAYQAFDDLLDRITDITISGKTPMRDAGKATAITACADDPAARARDQLAIARRAASEIGQGGPALRTLIDLIDHHFSAALRERP